MFQESNPLGMEIYALLALFSKMDEAFQLRTLLHKDKLPNQQTYFLSTIRNLNICLKGLITGHEHRIQQLLYLGDDLFKSKWTFNPHLGKNGGYELQIITRHYSKEEISQR
jgi:hypothetical protein